MKFQLKQTLIVIQTLVFEFEKTLDALIQGENVLVAGEEYALRLIGVLYDIRDDDEVEEREVAADVDVNENVDENVDANVVIVENVADDNAERY